MFKKFNDWAKKSNKDDQMKIDNLPKINENYVPDNKGIKGTRDAPMDLNLLAELNEIHKLDDKEFIEKLSGLKKEHVLDYM